MSPRRRLAVVVSHPIQYYVPLYRALAREPSIELHILFASRFGLETTFDWEMNVDVAWATDLTAGYSHEFLPEADGIKQIGFRDVDNPSVAGALARFKPDAAIIHGYAMMTMLRALAWCRLHSARAILASDSSAHGSPPGLRRTVKNMTLPWLLRQFSAALTMSDRAEQHLASLRYPRARMFRTPMMIDEGFWRAREQRPIRRARKRAELGLADDEFVVLSVAKLAPRKRMLDILAALSKLGVEHSTRRVTLLVAGDGEQKEALKSFAAERGLSTRFLGFVNIDALPELYAAADALVHAAEAEQYGMVVLEAAVMGLPLILSDETGAIGPTSIARPEANTLVFPRGDVAALAKALARLRDDSDLRRRLSDASRTISNDHAGPFSVAAVLKAMSA